ncbi:ABC branched chain amino acid transporter, periplasmic ligandbinding protein [Pseudooceanicola batsensis HTCC2597]|uniref:ABC branched chain amino acid transporter, periplasmic ligandbinding protein n=1 Tax=Pseudooceanicola batsensis (strain ATCC BAA-863 / DSM 15984 / KCTC 12145 / HTCC2597) TaxID=252305 RepID=A3TT33_PSEBH|nr:ABC transporter substrate-binding protein [Pseudooceanicola batsensis]EAQ04810.1 ABC branched chain amino acid transporter, periplasmic ligandbinding protein [Pseudooceanicola batsensis HTCC2597]
MFEVKRRKVLAGLGATALTAPFVSRMALAQGGDPINIGVVTALSGAQEFIGSFVVNGCKIAVDQINSKGGVLGRPLALETRDSRVSPADATTASRELIGNGTNLQIGTISSSVALAMGPLMAQEGGIMITCGAGSEKINHENYSPNVFRPGDGPFMRMRAQAQLMARLNPDVTSWTGFVPDHEYGRTTWAVFVDGLLEFYPEIAGKEPEILDPIIVPYGAGDYRSFITQAARSKATGIFNSTYGGDSVTLFQQAQPFKLFEERVLMDSANEFIVAGALGTKTPKHWTGIHWYHETNAGNPVSDALFDDYVKLTGDDTPMGWVAEAHAGILAYAAAIEKAGSTETDAVIAAMKGLEWETATGKRVMRAEDNQAIKDVELIYIEPDAEAKKGYAVTDYKKVDGNTVIEPATPGQAVELRSAN